MNRNQEVISADFNELGEIRDKEDDFAPAELAVFGRKYQSPVESFVESEKLPASKVVQSDHPRPHEPAKLNTPDSSVWVSLRGEDPTHLTVLVDRTAPQNRILNDLQAALPEFAVPYRELEPRIIEAIRIKANENITLEEASIRVLGSKKFPRSLRYWRNKWGIR
jgi:hypothetical protein